jgi:hypothetical protein
MRAPRACRVATTQSCLATRRTPTFLAHHSTLVATDPNCAVCVCALLAIALVVSSDLSWWSARPSARQCCPADTRVRERAARASRATTTSHAPRSASGHSCAVSLQLDDTSATCVLFFAQPTRTNCALSRTSVRLAVRQGLSAVQEEMRQQVRAQHVQPKVPDALHSMYPTTHSLHAA